jgi:hypothetical protein
MGFVGDVPDSSGTLVALVDSEFIWTVVVAAHPGVHGCLGLYLGVARFVADMPPGKIAPNIRVEFRR